MIRFVTGNFFDFDATIRVNTVNCVGVMGAGAALQFKNRFPKMFEDYVRECAAGKVQIGKPHLWTDNEIFNNSPIIINFPTKDDWKNPSEYEYVEKGLVWLRDYLATKGNVTITVPALGCGHGGLDWEKVKKMIVEHLDHLDAIILVFEPASSTSQDTPEHQRALLEQKGITLLAPSDASYPAVLSGKTAWQIYLKGNKDIFKQKLLAIIVDPKAEQREKAAILACIEQLPTEGFVYFLSYNSSFEIDLVKAVLSQKGHVALVFPYGILQVKIRKDIQALWDDARITLLSLSKPSQSWSVYESINALKFRIKIADAILFANQDLTPLTKIEKELKDTTNPVFYINYWNSKVDFYDQLNACQVGRDKQTLMPNVSGLYQRLVGV